MLETYEVKTLAFQAESLFINTSSSNKEIYLQELIFNALQALDKIRDLSLTDQTVLSSESELKIDVIINNEEKTFTIFDTGIGMTKADLEAIAKSRTKAGENTSIIRLFDVGFYSVADKVEVITKNNNDEQYVWVSSTDGSLTVQRDTVNEPLGRGTKITLHIKEDHLDFYEEQNIKNLIEKISTYPISFIVQNTRNKDAEIEKKKKKKNKKRSRNKKKKSKKSKSKIKKKENNSLVEHFNKLIQIDPNSITSQDYANLYKSFGTDSKEYYLKKDFSVDSKLKFRAILFVPKMVPFELSKDKKVNNSIELFVGSDCVKNRMELIPKWLNFVIGVVYVEDSDFVKKKNFLSNEILNFIRQNLVEKCIELFVEISTDKDEYKKFYEEYREKIIQGIHDDSQNRSKVADLLRYYSSASGDDMASLKDYIFRIKGNQRSIFYITGKSKEIVSNSFSVEKKKKKGCETLYLIDTIDVNTVQQLKEYNGKKFVQLVDRKK
ncbi:heat shock protein HSP 90-alpha [Hydra vulgaris]|uniref:heat shock protein HSP 90-alpha n=1 Tax=Hydra vulgaris TaxID=6087 RepID=UPI0032EA5A80